MTNTNVDEFNYLNLSHYESLVRSLFANLASNDNTVAEAINKFVSVDWACETVLTFLKLPLLILSQAVTESTITSNKPLSVNHVQHVFDNVMHTHSRLMARLFDFTRISFQFLQLWYDDLLKKAPARITASQMNVFATVWHKHIVAQLIKTGALYVGCVRCSTKARSVAVYVSTATEFLLNDSIEKDALTVLIGRGCVAAHLNIFQTIAFERFLTDLCLGNEFSNYVVSLYYHPIQKMSTQLTQRSVLSVTSKLAMTLWSFNTLIRHSWFGGVDHIHPKFDRSQLLRHISDLMNKLLQHIVADEVMEPLACTTMNIQHNVTCNRFLAFRHFCKNIDKLEFDRLSSLFSALRRFLFNELLLLK